jgi:hypothetical protein
MIHTSATRQEQTVKTFLYVRHDGKTNRNGATPYTVRIFHLSKGKTTLVASGTDSFVSEFQQVMMVAERAKLLPKKAFERGSFGGYKHHADSLREAKIANFRHIW